MPNCIGVLAVANFCQPPRNLRMLECRFMTEPTSSEHEQTNQRGLSRRQVLFGAGSIGAAAVAATATGFGSAAQAQTTTTTNPGRALPSGLFSLGVASGEPTADGFVLWTRLAPQPLAERGGMPDREVIVRYEIAEDANFTRVVRRGVDGTDTDDAHSVHAEVFGLRPGREYFYRFRVGNELSPVGRAKTAPAMGSSVNQFRFATISCNDWQNGYFTAFDGLAREDVDLIVHLGDSIYEYGPDPLAVRQHDGPELSSLASYRNRHALYKTDPAMQAALARAPWMVTPDDHEVENNYANDIDEERGTPAGESPEAFLRKRANAYQAYWEHMPLRTSARPVGPDMQIYRSMTFGNLLQLNMLDTRQFRTDQGPVANDFGPRPLGLDPASTLFGAAQEAWLFEQLNSSPAVWNALAQQVVMAQFEFAVPTGAAPPAPAIAKLFNLDAWDGYVAERTRVLRRIAADRIKNPVVLAGDIHSSWVNELTADFRPGSPVVAAELVCSSISSDFPVEFIPLVRNSLAANPHVRYFDGASRGYMTHNLTPYLWETQIRAVASIKTKTSTMSTLAHWAIAAGTPGPVR